MDWYPQSTVAPNTHVDVVGDVLLLNHKLKRNLQGIRRNPATKSLGTRLAGDHQGEVCNAFWVSVRYDTSSDYSLQEPTQLHICRAHFLLGLTLGWFK